jgi:HJR/Mrr/RecB family endonuclease
MSDPRGEEMIIAIEDIYANLDAWAADLAEARYWARRMKAQRDDLRNESDKLLMDLIDSEKERDAALQEKLDIAVKAIEQIESYSEQYQTEQCIYITKLAHDADAEINRIGGKNE